MHIPTEAQLARLERLAKVDPGAQVIKRLADGGLLIRRSGGSVGKPWLQRLNPYGRLGSKLGPR